MIDLPCSTKRQRQRNRAIAISELVNQASNTIAPQTLIPMRASQALYYTVGFFECDLKLYEKIINAIIAVIAIAEVALAMILFINGDLCALDTVMCRSLMALDFLYNAALVATWGLSESKKEDFNRDDFTPNNRV